MLRTDPMHRALESRGHYFSHAWRGWTGPLAISVATIWILVWYGPTVMSIVAIWSRSPTFTHGYLVVPIVLYLVWRDRHRLAAIPLVPCFPAQLLLALCGFGWLLAELAGVLGGMQFMVAAMIPACIWAIGGTALVRALAFPLGFLFFAVPIGEFMVPALQDWTADFAIAALRLSGIPVLREGLNFSIPTGRWSVVEECSGINYLIASVTVGTLYAYLTYRSLSRRLVLIGLFAVVPLISNGIRAYLIVLIAHLSANRFATGVDHIWLGWFLFGAVMLLVFWITSFWHEKKIEQPAASPPFRPISPRATDAQIVVALAAALVLIAIWRPAAALLENRSPNAAVELAIHGAGGWEPVSSPLIDWEPEYARPTATLSSVFNKGRDSVGLKILYYRNQGEDRKLITSANQLVKSQNKSWRVVASGRSDEEIAGRTLPVRTTVFTNGLDQIVAWHWYWVSGRFTSSEMVAKIHLALSKLRGHGDDSALIVIYTRRDGSGGSQEQPLADFAAAMGGTIQRTLADAQAR